MNTYTKKSVTLPVQDVFSRLLSKKSNKTRSGVQYCTPVVNETPQQVTRYCLRIKPIICVMFKLLKSNFLMIPTYMSLSILISKP